MVPHRTSTFAALLVVTFAAPALGQKQAHPMITAYPGSELEAPPQVSAFDEYEIPVGKMAGGASMPSKKVEGKVTMFYYRNPNGRSVLEVFRNYEAAFTEAGFTPLFTCRGTAECGDPRPIKGLGRVPYDSQSRYFAAIRSTPAGVVHVAMHIEPNSSWFVIVEGKPMETGMAKVTAEALGKDIMSEGHVAVYDILFDTAKADLKPESMAALEQIAAMLAKNASLNLYVVGHTDNMGTLAQNIDLSKRRAAAVVAALTTKHKIAATRLTADGVGPLAPVASNDAESGRAKNRRVELVKQ